MPLPSPSDSSSLTSVEAKDYINALMLNFRELIVDMEREGDYYRKELANLKGRYRHSAPIPPLRRRSLPVPPERAPTTTITDSSTSTVSVRGQQTDDPKRTRVDPRRRTMTTQAAATTVRGALIVLEGLDRVGKSTLAKKLVDHLEKTNKPVAHCRFPDRTTPVGQLIDEYLKSSSQRVDNHVMHLLFSANRWELAKRIRNTLFQGKTVIVDRYSYSGIAYSSAKKDLTLKWCCEMECGLPRPDLVIYLDLPPEAQYKRPGFGDERFETRALQDLVRLQYERVMELSKETWLKVNVENKNPDQVLGEVIIRVRRCLDACATKDLSTLEFFDVPQSLS